MSDEYPKVKCPHCGEMVGCLSYSANLSGHGFYKPGVDLIDQFALTDAEWTYSFCCPECSECICTEGDDAEAFLKGGKINVTG